MATETSAEGRAGRRWAGVARTVLGIGIVLSGLWAVVTIAYWYGSDNVFVGGSHLRDPAAARLPAFVAVAVLVLGVVVLVARRRLRGGVGLVGLACLTVIGVVAAASAVSGYPSATRARLTSHGDPATGAVPWTTVVPLTIVSELVTVDDATVVVTGSAMDHGCNGTYLAVAIDRSDGKVLDVATSSSPHYLGTSPIDPEVPAAQGLEVEQGVSQVTCSY